MPAFEREQVLTSADLNWYIEVAGTLTDQYEVSYQIWDIIDDPTGGTQIFPTTPDDWEEVTTSGKFATGSYYPYDNAEARGWKVPADARIGSHRIKWRWKAAETSPLRYGQEDFSIVLEAGGVATYIDIVDVRNAGITEDIATDSEVLASILLWQAILDRACRQWFLPRELTILFDGTDRDFIHLGVPVISVEYLKINGTDDALDESLYKVYSSRTYPDDRRNPRIKLVHSQYLSDIYTHASSYGEMRFRRGYQNQELKGIFGFTEPDGTTPDPIKRALLLLVVEKLTHPAYTDPSTPAPDPSGTTIAGVVVSEKTDGHEIKYGSGSFKDRRTGGLSGITQNTEVLTIVKLYRAALGVATPANWSYA